MTVPPMGPPPPNTPPGPPPIPPPVPPRSSQQGQPTSSPQSASSRRSWKTGFGMNEKFRRLRSKQAGRQRRSTSGRRPKTYGGMPSALAVFILIWIGTSVASLTYPEVAAGSAYGKLAVALAFGLALATGLWVAGPTAQANPAETFALSIRGHQAKSAMKLILFQMAGAIVASLLVGLMLDGPGRDTAKLGAALPGAYALWPAVFLVEFIGTYLVVRSGRSAEQPSSISPMSRIVIPAVTLSACMLATITVSGGSFNPARSIGTPLTVLLTGGSLGDAMVHLNLFGFWVVYLLAQLAGAYLGVGKPIHIISSPRP